LRVRLTKEANADIVRILRNTKRLFGATQVSVYAQIIDEGVRLIGENPRRPSSFDRGDIRPGVRSFHLALIAFFVDIG